MSLENQYHLHLHSHNHRSLKDEPCRGDQCSRYHEALYHVYCWIYDPHDLPVHLVYCSASSSDLIWLWKDTRFNSSNCPHGCELVTSLGEAYNISCLSPQAAYILHKISSSFIALGVGGLKHTLLWTWCRVNKDCNGWKKMLYLFEGYHSSVKLVQSLSQVFDRDFRRASKLGIG